jgi:hypothetical protein
MTTSALTAVVARSGISSNSAGGFAPLRDAVQVVQVATWTAGTLKELPTMFSQNHLDYLDCGY